MVVVSDTSPISALAHVNQLQLLPQLFGSILVPPAVAAELRVVAGDWKGLEILAVAGFRVTAPSDSRRVAAFLAELDLGESEAIVLALESGADALLMDETAGRAVAAREGLEVVGTLAVLERAKQRRLVERVLPLVDRLTAETSFFVSQRVYDALRARVGE